MSYTTVNGYKNKRINISEDLAKYLEQQKLKTGLSIPKISNELAGYLRSQGWEFQPAQIKVNNLYNIFNGNNGIKIGKKKK